MDGLQLPEAQYSEELQYQGIQAWDSTGHMTLIVELEKQFDVMLNMEDIIDMSSVEKVKAILGKYDVTF